MQQFCKYTITHPVRVREDGRTERLVGHELVKVAHQLKRFEGACARRVHTLQLIAQVHHLGRDGLHGGVEVLKVVSVLFMRGCVALRNWQF